MIEVRLFATFREGRKKIYQLNSDDFATAQDILDYLKIEKEDVSILLINGFHSEAQTKVKEGDVVALFPPVGGG